MAAIFLAPRSGEQSTKNFQKTLEGGYKKSDIITLLSKNDIDHLTGRGSLFIWGNRPGNKGPWQKMQNGDYIFFYQKGTITYVGQLIYKTHNLELAKELWGMDKDSEQYWEYVFFADKLTPVNIDYSILKRLGGYKENHIVQGFQSFKAGSKAIIEQYGSIDDFLDNFKIGPTSKQVATLDKIAEKTEAETGPEDLAKLDEISREQELAIILEKLALRNKNQTPERIQTKLSKIKRDYYIVQELKKLYDNECQICGIVIEKRNEGRYSEVAHIKALSGNGQDNIGNLLVLCPNHHKMLDFGNLNINLETKEATMGLERHKLTNRHL